MASIASAATATQIGLSVIPDWTADGSQTGCEFGYSVNTAGDVNGDGYDDVIVGSSKYELDVYREGAAFLYYGSTSGVSDLPEWSSAGGYSGGRFGNSVASAGDVNNDGYDDIIVGASRYKNGETDEGAAYVYYGNSMGPSTVPDWRIESNLANAQFGYAVASAGDVNGDDFDDVIVGARWYTLGHENEGAIFVYLGSSSGLNPAHSWMYESNQSEAALGSSVASAGDVNGDGYSDIVAGAPFCDRGETDEGCIYIFLGSPTGLPDLPELDHWQRPGGSIFWGFRKPPRATSTEMGTMILSLEPAHLITPMVRPMKALPLFSRVLPRECENLKSGKC